LQRRGSADPRSFRALYLIAAALLTAVLMLSIQLGAARGESEPASEAEATRTELPEERTATSDTYLLDSGALQTELFSSPVNYETDGGEWKPIDEGLEEAPAGGITNGANSFDLQLPEEMGAGPVRVSEDGDWISYRYLGAATDAAEVNGATATYEAPSGALSFELQSMSDGLKENIVLGSASQPSEYRFALDLSDGLTPELLEDGSIAIREADGKVFGALPAPVISDSSGGLNGPASAVHYHLEAAPEGEWLLSVIASEEWLSDPARSYPVTVDPSVKLLNSTLDCDLGSLPAPKGWHECGTTGAKELTVAYSQKEKQPVRTFLRFPFGSEKPSSLNTTSYVLQAVLGLYAPAAAENTTGLETRRVTKSWNSELNWESPTGKSDKESLWTTPGGDFNSEGLAEVLTSKRGSAAGWWNFESESLRKLVAGWAAGSTSNYGLLVKQNNETRTAECESSGNCPRRYVAFYPSNAESPEKRPKLTVTYYPTAPEGSVVTLPSEGTVTGRRLRLQAGWSAPGVTGVTFLYREGKSGPFEKIPSSLVRDENNQPVSWPIAVTGVQQSKVFYFDAAHATPTLQKKGGVIQVRALFDATGTEGVSPPVEAKVDRGLGGPNDARAQVGPGTLDLLTGNLSVTRSDVSIPAFRDNLSLSRTFNSRGVNLSKTVPPDQKESPYEVEMKKVLGPGWEPSGTMEAAGSIPWASIRMTEESESFPDENDKGEPITGTITHAYATLKSVKGEEFSFEKNGSEFVTPPELVGSGLTKNGSGQFVLAAPGGERTTFANTSGGSEYLPVSVSLPGGAGEQMRLIYDTLANGKRRLNTIVAPTPPAIGCSSAPTTFSFGCKALKFNYTTFAYGDRLTSISFYGPSEGSEKSWEVAKFAYNSEGFLVEAWDPRISPALKETYTYTTTGQLKTITPPGQQPWTLEYGFSDEEEGAGRLVKIKRPSLLASPTTAQTTIAYGVPVSGSGAPYDLSTGTIAKWGQQDIPVDATAIFPPDQIPASPPSSYSHANVYYMDSEGTNVNTATPAGAGTTSASITTTETDQFGNVTRELTAQNRLRALAAPAGETAQRAAQLDTHRTFSADGTEMQEEWGPLHQVELSSGKSLEARPHRVVLYDECSPECPSWSPSNPEPHLPTLEATGASIAGESSDADKRTTTTKYNWSLLQPTETIVDPGEGEALNIRSVTVYDTATGLPVEQRQPSNPGGGGAGTTKILYYNDPGADAAEPGCESTAYAGLPCKVLPASQPDAGLPEIPVKKFLSYNQLGEPLTINEATAGHDGRTTTMTYDAAGRLKTKKIEGGGESIPKTEVEYSSTLGLPTVEKFLCQSECTGFDNQAVTSAYDTLGRQSSYEDADGNKATTTYDLLGRPATVTDAKGTQTLRYDGNSGLLVELEDSAAGLFTASYDADGNMTERELPDGLVAKTTFDPTGEPVHLTYTKLFACGTSCTWLDFGLERSIYGQILSENGTLGTQSYGYDKAGRLLSAQETPKGGSCTTRVYAYDADSNRKSLTTRSPGLGGACASSGGTEQKYSYDQADRLKESGIAYDELGRITNLPGSLAGGKELTTSYFANDMVASQSQNGVTNTFQLDASLRQRQRLQGGGLEGAEVFHYDGRSDSPAWTERGSTWTRSIIGIGGELAAIQESGKEITLQLTNLHGDVSATAAINPAVTSLKATFDYDEFGNPTSGSAGRFGWLGGQQRRTEFGSGVVQMGARSYMPAIGRFISPDPIEGASANAYDYVNADPVMGFDLAGKSPGDRECYSPGPTCECVLWSHMAKGSRRGTLFVTTVRKCAREGGITLQGYAVQWSKRGPYSDGWHDISAPQRVYPAVEPACTQINAPCQNYQKTAALYYCEPGKEYRMQVTWGFVFNIGGKGEEHYLDISVDQTCPK
jgi:RHS repeat-associated protein